MLFRSRPGADCYRVLGIKPAASRATARDHMRWLLEWLHPDRNNNSWDAVYAERVLKAWREVSASKGSTAKPSLPLARASFKRKKKAGIRVVPVPWIERPVVHGSLAIRSSRRVFILWALPTGIAIIFLAWWSANLFLQP